MEYINSKKLICHTPTVAGQGEIIVTTYSGGKGKCTVTFTGLEPERAGLLGKGVACVRSRGVAMGGANVNLGWG